MKKNYPLNKTITLALYLLSFYGFSQVSFNASPSTGCAPQLVNFTYTGNPSGTYFRWYFGDGDSSHVKNPSHTFLNPGWFDVSLSVWDTTNKAMIYLGSTNNNIQINGATNFDVSTPSACPGEEVRFGFNQANYNNITWDFGDSTQNEYWNNTSHAFKYAGVHNVKMTINTSCGTKIITRPITVSNTAKPVFTIGVNQNYGCLNDVLYFSANYPATSYLWDFGDGSTSTVENPSHAYTTPGNNKRVILTATNNCGGSNRDTLYVDIKSVGFNAYANMNLWPNPVCPNSVINMSVWQSGIYKWYLGDGTTSTERSPSNFYTSTGTYTVSLVVTNGCGSKDSVSQTLTVGGGGGGMYNNVDIGFQNTNGPSQDTMKICPGTTVDIANFNSWTGAKYSFLWKFGDGATATTKNASHKYTAVGYHKVVLIVTDPCGNADSASKVVYVNPNMPAKFNLQAIPDTLCPGGTAYFFDDDNKNGGNVYSIIFGDGTSVNNITGPTDTIVQVLAAHKYNGTGTFKYKFYATNACGKTDSLIRNIVVRPQGSVYPFYYVDNSTSNNHGGNNDNSGCPGNGVKFTAVGGISYSWIFGDGKFGSGQVAYHSYSAPGNYNAKCIIVTACGKTDTVPTQVFINTTNKPQSYFNMDKAFACSGDSIRFMSENNNGSDKPNTNSYMWDFGDGATSTALNPAHVYSAKGVYSVTLTVTNGCGSNSQTESVIIDKPAVSITSLASAYCNYSTAVTLSATPAGGAFKVDGSATTTFDPTALTVGSHTVTYLYTNSNGCSTTASQPVTINKTIADAGADVSVCAGGNAQLNASGGTSYLWTPATNLSNAAIANPVASPSGTATYTVTVTKNGCIATDAVQVTVAASLTANAGSNTAICNGGSTILNGSGGGNYSWAPAGTLSNAAIPNPVAMPTTTTIYTLTVSSGSCNATSTVAVTVNPAVIITNLSSANEPCNGSALGAANVVATGGTGAMTYIWSNGGTAQTISSVIAATYTVTVTDTKGCSSTSSVTITEPAKITATTSSTGALCNGGNTGSAAVTASGGTGSYTYSWNSGATGQTASGLVAATYTVTVKDANGCTTTSTAAVSQSSAIVPSTFATTNVSCKGGNNGSALASATGGTGNYAYTWNTAATSQAISGLTAAIYTVTIKDAANCTTTATVTITEPASLVSVTLIPNNVKCKGGNGQITSSVSGGTPGYSYSWSNTQTSLNITAVAGVYALTVTDAKGCIKTVTTTITEPATLLSASTGSIVNPLCNGASTGSATAAGTGGVTGYQYSWSSGATTAVLSNADAGTYTCTITDAIGCAKTATAVITEPAAIVPSAPVSASSCGASNGSVSATAVGGTGTLLFSLNGGPFTASGLYTGLTAGSYTVSVKDANACLVTIAANVSNSGAAVIGSITKTDVKCNGGNGGSAFVSASGGTGTLTYSWSTGSTVTTISTLTASGYTVTVIDAGGCKAISSVIITEPDVLYPVVTVVANASCNGVTDGTAISNPTGGSGTYTYTWNNTATGQTVSGLGAGTFTVTVTDANNCTATSSVTISQPAPFVPTITVTGGTQLTASPGATYQWNLNGTPISGATSQNYVAIQTGNYSVTETDGNGCNGTSAPTNVTITGIHAASVANRITIFPNPNNGTFNLVIGNDRNESVAIRIFDITGKVIHSEILNVSTGTSSYVIDLSGYAAGSYTLQSVFSEKVLNKKIVIQ